MIDASEMGGIGSGGFDSELTGRVLREVVHDLNGHASALLGLSEIEWGDGSGGFGSRETELISLLGGEGERIAALARLIALLIPPESFGEAEVGAVRNGGRADGGPFAREETLVDPRGLVGEAATLVTFLRGMPGDESPLIGVEGSEAGIPAIRCDAWLLRGRLVRYLFTELREEENDIALMRGIRIRAVSEDAVEVWVDAPTRGAGSAPFVLRSSVV